ncbi:MAG TPA: VacB/RNase II family 3'-5' exoribonuclease [bacterium]|nr:VacB/RNase II family 3'-5' exoribonuclease [bacterium]
MNQRIDDKRILDFLGGRKNPAGIKEIMGSLKIPAEKRQALKKRLREMSEKGEIVRKKNKFGGSRERVSKTVTGRVQIKKNFGFILSDDGEDVFLGRGAVAGLLSGDIVEAYVKKSDGGGREGEIKAVLKRTKDPVVCRAGFEGDRCYAVPVLNGGPVIRLSEDTSAYKENDMLLVVVEEKEGKLWGKVISHIYDEENISLYKQFALARHSIKREFPENALKEAEGCALETDKNPAREDLRAETIITIDPADAKDFDDAVSLKYEGGRYVLGVHIADVSHYVREEGALDIEARSRGLSVYLPDEVIPMLPERLSNQTCSLRPGEDKAVFSVIMDIDPEGNITGYKFKEALIKTAKRLTYEEAQEIITGQGQAPEGVKQAILLMDRLREVLGKKLKNGGYIDFSVGEPVLEFDAQGEVCGISRKEALEAHRLIEFFMISANICAADFIEKNLGTGIFRVHEPPALKDILGFNMLMSAMNLPHKIKKGKSSEFQAILEAAKNSEKKFLIEKSLLRAMRLAKYSEKNTGHFGLGLERYSHFTSPIRRYADLVAHRLIKKIPGIAETDVSGAWLKESALIISEREAAAEKAESEVFRVYALHYLKKRRGERLKAVITRVSKNGLSAEPLDIPVEGFLNFEDMSGDYFVFDEERQSVTGRRTKKTYRTGSVVSVIIKSINMESQRMNLELC